MGDYNRIVEIIRGRSELKQELREIGVVKSERPESGEIGEWFVEEVFGGERAKSQSQKGWDLIVDGKKIQVKSNAKGDNNNARWTTHNYKLGDFDDMIILVFEKDAVRLKEAWRAPIDIILERSRGRRNAINWDDLKEYKLDLNTLPNQDLVQLFLEES